VKKRPPKRLLWRLVRWALICVVALYAFFALGLLALRWINPITTGVQAQRRVESWLDHKKYQKHYTFLPLERIGVQLQHAVISAEDGRFYQHRGIDWKEVEKVMDDSLEDGKVNRGASTITQQLVKNLFFTTHRSAVRKVIEFTLAPICEALLSKQRILELYLNTAEWGPGVFGAEAAATFHYGVSANHLSREQAARLAACLPAPRRRKPQRMDNYSASILGRMAQTGW
jgi:monofunctional biosynthetic peptidoglycan transglycosylase